MMTEKIGKLSFLFGAILSILLIIIGFACMQFELLSHLFEKDEGYYPLFMFIPFAVMFVSHLTACLLYFCRTKN